MTPPVRSSVIGATAAAIVAFVPPLTACSDSDESEVVRSESVPACATDLEPELARLGVPGLSAGIVKNGQLVCTAVAGLANIEEGRTVTPDTMFWWASVSKPVTATAAMSVVEDGGFDLVDPVNDYLPFRVEHPDQACVGKQISFRQLLTHTSSVHENESRPAYRDAFAVGEPRQPLGTYLRSYLVPGGALYDPEANFLTWCPGEGNHYSSIGFGLLGYAVEEATGQPFDQLNTERIFGPLGMDDTSFTLADLGHAELAMGYDRKTNATFEPVGYQEHANYPDGSLRSSVPDLARFMIMTMEGGELDGTRILEERTVRAMLRPQIPDLDRSQGFAWYHDRYAGREVIGHDGYDPGATSFLFFDPADNAGVLLVANGEWRYGAAEALLATLFRESSDY